MERTKTISWDDPQTSKRDAIALISGLDYLTAIKDQKIGPAPVGKLVGYKICEVEYGYAVFELLPEEYHYNPFATVHGGMLSTLLDTTMAASILSTLPEGFSCTSIEIKINFVKPVSVETGMLRCEARPIHVGKKIATAEGKLKNKDGMLHAHGVCTCSIFKIT